jgi:CBS domain-containing protein
MAAESTLVRESMTAYTTTVDPDTTVLDAARIMRQEDVGSLPVVQGDRLLGIITDRDIATRVVAENKDPETQTVAAIATREVVTVGAGQQLAEALQLMARHQVRRLPVLDEEDRLVGILAQADVALVASPESTGLVIGEISEPHTEHGSTPGT